MGVAIVTIPDKTFYRVSIPRLQRFYHSWRWTWGDAPGFVRLKARVVGEVEVLFRQTLSGL